MNLESTIDNFISKCLNQRKFNLEKYKKNKINEINIIGNILEGKVIGLFNENNLYCCSSQNKCQSDKIGYNLCENTSSFKTGDRINLCWKHSYLYTQNINNS